MEFKPHEIALIVLAVALPTIFIVMAFIPGALGFLIEFVIDPRYRYFVFFGGAAVAFGFLAWRIYRRIRPARKKLEPKIPHVSPTKMPKI